MPAHEFGLKFPYTVSGCERNLLAGTCLHNAHLQATGMVLHGMGRPWYQAIMTSMKGLITGLSWLSVLLTLIIQW